MARYRSWLYWLKLAAGSLTLLLLVNILSSLSSSEPKDLTCSVDDVRTLERNPSVVDIGCEPNVPCQYPDKVDLRIIVMTWKRAGSLKQTLESLQSLELDGGTASLEIWIDRDAAHNTVDCQTLRVAVNFVWKRGEKRVHIHQRHVGIYGQWINTWRPDVSGSELALMLEDDLTVSPYAYRWIRAAHDSYWHRSDIAGYTLQSEEVSKATGQGKHYAIKGPPQAVAYLFIRVGTWGYAPHPIAWRSFQDWYHSIRHNASFHPYVDAAPVITGWYKGAEKKGTADHMWSMWHVYFTDQENQFTVYSNLGNIVDSINTKLASNRKSAGLHYDKSVLDKLTKTKNNADVMTEWKDFFDDFPEKPVRYDWDGRNI